MSHSKLSSPRKGKIVFNDSLDKFVDILKKTTQATVIHIYNKSLF